MVFKDEIENLTGARPDSWTWKSWEPDNDGHAYIWFGHHPGEDIDGQPLTFLQLEKIDAKYGIVKVESVSDGKTGSQLCVEIRDP